MPRQLDSAANVLDRFRGDVGLVRMAEVERPAVMGVVLPSIRIELQGAAENLQRALVGALGQQALALLKLHLRLQSLLVLALAVGVALALALVEHVLAASARICEGLVGEIDLGECLTGQMCDRVTGSSVVVRMELSRPLLIRGLDLFLAG